MPQPLKTWLSKSYLTTAKEHSIVLFIEPEFTGLLQNMEYLSKIYPIIKEMYPDALSLHVTSSSLMEHAKSQILEFELVDFEQD